VATLGSYWRLGQSTCRFIQDAGTIHFHGTRTKVHVDLLGVVGEGGSRLLGTAMFFPLWPHLHYSHQEHIEFSASNDNVNMQQVLQTSLIFLSATSVFAPFLSVQLGSIKYTHDIIQLSPRPSPELFHLEKLKFYPILKFTIWFNFFFLRHVLL
jgi:hypothetical protein